MRISDWSSDVCSSDLHAEHRLRALRVRLRGGHSADHHRHRHGRGVHLRPRPPLGAVMPVATLTDGRQAWQRRTTRRQLAIWLAWLACVAVFMFCWQLSSDRTIWLFVTDPPPAAAAPTARLLPHTSAHLNHPRGA